MSTDVTHVELEEIEITSTEKVLALVLTVFFLIGGIWVYAKLDDIRDSGYRAPEAYFTPAEQAAVERANRAQVRLDDAGLATERAREELELSREAYRTALDAGASAPDLRAAYRDAERDFAGARRQQSAARAAAAAAQPAASAAYARAGQEADDASRQSELVTFGLRLAFLLATFALAYWLLIRLRRSGSRYLPVAFALVAAGALLALVLACDYLTDYIDVQELGPLVLSLAGIAMTLAVFWWLQRYLARRLPARRVRRGECPFCGYPARGSDHCEGCGRAATSECIACHGSRRVGTLHCGVCGAA